MSDAKTHEPEPKEGNVIVSKVVLGDIVMRVKMGEEKYGTKLMSHNGRDALWDAYQEALDLVFYLRQAIIEADSNE